MPHLLLLQWCGSLNITIIYSHFKAIISRLICQGGFLYRMEQSKCAKKHRSGGALCLCFNYASTFGEVVLTYEAQGAFEIFGQIFELGAGSDAALGVTFCLVVFPAADIANIFHKNFLLDLFFVFLPVLYPESTGLSVTYSH